MRIHATLLLLAGGCTTPPLGPMPEPVRLVVENPAGHTLALLAVVDNAIEPVVALGAAGQSDLRLQPGAYLLEVTTAAASFCLPAPLFAAALPPDRTLTLSLAELPTAVPDDPDFAYVPAGPTLRGDTLGIGQADEQPPRIEAVAAFWIARTETTNRDFAAFLNTLSGPPEPTWAAFDSRKFRCQRRPDGTWTTDAPDLPVVTVSHAGAVAYCAWRTRVTGVVHRLPHEAEWEKAARGPASLVYAYGNRYRRHAANQESGTLRPVASHPATGFGTFDLTGNAFEWTADRYPSADPADDFYVLRGGSFVLDGMYLRNSFRMRQRADTRTDDFGFRVVRDAIPPHRP